MRVQPIKTHSIAPSARDLLAIVDRYVRELRERSVLAITSKSRTICTHRS